MKRLVLTLCIVILAGSAYAEGEVYTLEQCIQMAMDKDPTLTQFRNAVKTANATVWQQTGNFLPSADLYYRSTKSDIGADEPSYETVEQWAPVYNNTFDTITDFSVTRSTENVSDPAFTARNYSAGIGFNWVLFDGLQNVWNYLGSRASKRGAEYSFSSASSDLTFMIKGYYYLALKAKKDLEVAIDATNRSKELLKLFEEKYELGSASLSEVLKQKVQYGNDQLTAVRAEYALANAFDELALNIGLDPQVEYDIAGIQYERKPVEDIGFYIQKALEQHPALLSSHSDVDAYNYDVRSAWGWYLPRLSLSYDYGWAKPKLGDLVDFGSYGHTSTLGVSVSWSIFDGFTREANLTRAKAGLNNSKARLFYDRNKVIKDVEVAHIGINLANETVRVTEEIKRSASEDMELVQEKYNLGAAALWELLDAQVSLKEAEFNNVKAVFDYYLAVAKLQNAIGE
jgi:outer membrane protein TolC